MTTIRRLGIVAGVLASTVACAPAEETTDGGTGGSASADGSTGGSASADGGTGGSAFPDGSTGGSASLDSSTGGGTGGSTGGSTGGGTGGSTGGSTGGGTGGSTGGGTGGSPGSDWVVSAHPCVGNRTDTLWFDDPQTAWVGCGTTTEGYGLFRTTDAGQTWASPATRPAGFFDDFRVSTVSRSADGVLYVGGTRPGGARVVSLDTSAEPFVVGEVLMAGNRTWNTFHVGTFRRNAAGLAVAESLTGTDLAYRTADDQPFQDGAGWWGEGESHQLLDLVLQDDAFYGCGSTISQPPMVFLPPATPAEAFKLTPVVLATGIAAYAGEMWGLAADAGGVVVGGVNQDRGVGMVYTSRPGADLTTAAGWNEYDVSLLPADRPTWVRGVCRSGSASGAYVVAVGEYSRDSEGFVLLSLDDGLTFADVTPQPTADVPPLHRCTVWADGTLAVTGGGGFFARRGQLP